MGKNQSKTYLLIAIVVIVWSVLIFKFVSDISDNSNLPQAVEISSFRALAESKKHTYDIVPVNRDPFLEIPYGAKSKSKNSKSSNTNKNIQWPQIKYKGIIKGEKYSSYIVQINGQDKILSRGEEFEGIKLVRGNASTVILRFKSTSKEFEK